MKGIVVGPDGKPAANVPLNISTEPPTINFSVTTSSDGSWSVNDSRMIVN